MTNYAAFLCVLMGASVAVAQDTPAPVNSQELAALQSDTSVQRARPPRVDTEEYSRPEESYRRNLHLRLKHVAHRA